jgi:hypothetical protein
VRDIYLVSVDGLKGFPQAIESLYPKAQVQMCIVHMTRQPELRHLAGPQEGGRGLKANLQGRNCG